MTESTIIKMTHPNSYINRGLSIIEFYTNRKIDTMISAWLKNKKNPSPCNCETTRVSNKTAKKYMNFLENSGNYFKIPINPNNDRCNCFIFINRETLKKLRIFIDAGYGYLITSENNLFSITLKIRGYCNFLVSEDVFKNILENVNHDNIEIDQKLFNHEKNIYEMIKVNENQIKNFQENINSLKKNLKTFKTSLKKLKDIVGNDIYNAALLQYEINNNF